MFYPSHGADYCDSVWCYNYKLKSWTQLEFVDNLSLYGNFQLELSVTIEDLVGTIAQQDWRIGSRTSLASAPRVLFGDIDGYVYEYGGTIYNDDGTLVNGSFDTKDFNPTQFMQQFRVTRLDVYYIGMSLQVGYSTNKGVSWSLARTISGSSSLDTVHHVWLRTDTNQIRFRFQNNTAGEYFNFSRANMFWEPSGGRLS